jgi:DNA-directed RNA polymerase III subunit RPC1
MEIRDNNLAHNVAPTTSINFSKRPFIEDVGPRKIKSIHFTTMSGPEIVKVVEIHVYESNIFVTPDQRPCDRGIQDTRLGPSYKTRECTT